jgi:phosphoglucosamine mutase
VTTRLFGTDGMRGTALQYPLDQATVSRLGAVLAAELRAEGLPARLLLAGDTRASTAVLAGWLGGAFVGAGGEVAYGGVLPTPAVAHLLRDDGNFGAGAVISASHNPAADNGIKLLSNGGIKWPAAKEHALEDLFASSGEHPPIGELSAPDAGFAGRYLDLVLATLPDKALAGLSVVVDAAHGAASPVAGALFSSLGADVHVINHEPDGHNINLGCGALHPEGLAKVVVERRASAGVALDGDADRAILVTGAGRVLNGDDVLFLWAMALKESGRLPREVVVATVMSNLGLDVRLRAEGVRLVRCPVGDREVWDAMAKESAALGGEQSGHIICSRLATTGDGLLTAAHVLAIVAGRAQPLEQLATLAHFPQVLVNVRVGTRRPVADVPQLAKAIRDAESELAGNGRVFVRYSGTEPLLRIMVEAPTHEVATVTANRLATFARTHLA